MPQDLLLTGCKLATLQSVDTPYGMIENGAMVLQDGKIAWVGSAKEIPARYETLNQQELGGRLVTPALIDCHTHLVFGGSRAQEFEMRLNGVTYEEIARNGGGIVSTVKATRTSSDDELLSSSLKRLDDLISEGVGVVEIKSGYGLTIKDEVRMLRIARELETRRPVKVVTTWLAAHAIPPEYNGRSDDYIDEIVIPGLKVAAGEGLVDAVDGFCETIGFTPAQITRVFEVAKSLGLRVKLHAEQLSDQKGALLCAKYGGLSADHLEYLDVGDVEKFASSSAVAVLLPGAYYTLKETKLPPIDEMRAHGVDMAVATDCNPGSSPISSILTIMNMACTEFGMTPEEVVRGVTCNAAKALGLNTEYGLLAKGFVAELAVWNLNHPAELTYWMGRSPLHMFISRKPNI